MVDAKDEPEGDHRKVRTPSMPDLAKVRDRLAHVLWLVCVVFALFLAVGALLIVLGSSIDRDNALVEFVLDGAKVFDLDVFSIDGGVVDFVGKNSDEKNALANYGMGAVLWLVVGRVLQRVVRP